jgi:hypothetical protein
VRHDAVWVPGLDARDGWLLGEIDPGTGAAVGSWRLWKPPWDAGDEDALTSWEQIEFTGGHAVRRREYARYRLRDSELAGLRHQNGFPLYRELHYDERGEVRLKRDFHGHAAGSGLLHHEFEACDDGTSVNRHYYSTGGLLRERVTRGEVLVTAEWFAEDGTRTAVVSPAAEPYPGSDCAAVQVELWQGLDDGRLIAKGYVLPEGDPVGLWRLLDAGGQQYATVDFTPLTSSGLKMMSIRHDLGQIAVALYSWQQAPDPAELAGVHDIGWAALATFFGDAGHIPFLLKGLAQPDPLIFAEAMRHLYVMLEHQYTIADATGPAVRYLVALVPATRGDDQRAQLLEFVARLALAAGLGVPDVRDAYQEGFPAVPDGHSSTADDDGEAQDPAAAQQSIVDAATDEVCAAISAATGLWASLAVSPHRKMRRWAVVLLAFAMGEHAAAALRQRADAETDPLIRAEAVAGLALHRNTAPARELLARQIAAVADEPLAGFCAALSWLWTRAEPAGPRWR